MAELEIDVRKASPEDADAIARLMVCLGYPTTTEQMRTRLETIALDPAYGTFVAIMKGETVGMAGVCICPLYEQDNPAGRIVALCIDPNSRRSGAGTILVEHAEQWLRDRGVMVILVNSGTNRRDAHAFYGRRGYSATGVRFKKSL